MYSLVGITFGERSAVAQLTGHSLREAFIFEKTKNEEAGQVFQVTQQRLIWRSCAVRSKRVLCVKSALRGAAALTD
jgi:hypothetical protein